MMEEPTTQRSADTAARTGRRVWVKLGLLTGLVGVAGGLAWHTGARLSKVGVTPEGEAVDAAFWQQTLNQPDGTLVSLSAFQGRALVLNFWATWCPPCVEEMPLLNSFYQQNKANGWQVVGIAVDQLNPVRRFVEQNHLEFPVLMAGFAGIDLSKRLGNAQGSLPFTAVFSAASRLVHRKMGRLGPSDLLTWLAPPRGR
ncbi:MAG: TlpA disulfide reductase family protein [Rhodoferax sp.]